jgi:hypothetical protein
MSFHTQRGIFGMMETSYERCRVKIRFDPSAKAMINSHPNNGVDIETCMWDRYFGIKLNDGGALIRHYEQNAACENLILLEMWRRSVLRWTFGMVWRWVGVLSTTITERWDALQRAGYDFFCP